MTALEIVLTSTLGALVLLIIIVVFANHLFNKAMDKKIKDYKVLNEYAPLNPIVFLGDSLTHLYPVHEFIHDERVVNRGISNETTFDIMERIDDIISLSPRAVILLAGINDFLRKKVKSPLEVSKNVISIIEKLRQSVDQIYVVSLYPINKKKLKFSKLYLRHVTNNKILVTNEYLRKYCEEKGLKYIDINSKLTDENRNLNKDYTLEGLHLNLQGYNAISPIYKDIVESIK